MKSIAEKVFLCCVLLLVAVDCDAISDDSVTFWVLPGSGMPKFNSTFNESLSQRGCSASGKFAIIIHGWLESYTTDWVQDLISNLTVHRGGCIIVMDYSNYSTNPNYFLLVPQFEELSQLLLRFMRQLEAETFDFGNGYMFGFSFGAHLAISTALRFGEKRFREIDVCDAAGPGFEHLNMGDASLAAENVQCIHTSNSYGTMKRNCTQNWSMGYCGWAQFGAGPFPKGSHGLCPVFYNAAFQHDFIAWTNIYLCPSTRATMQYPEHYRMGYLETRKTKVSGDLFSPTSTTWPFNQIPGRSLARSDINRILLQEAFNGSSLVDVD